MGDQTNGTQSSLPASDDVFDENKYLETVFEAFVCPLTKQVMKDPVTLENGHTYEREAIEKWFKECSESDENRKLVCPLTKMELRSTDLTPNVALQKTIREWNLRDEYARLKLACKAISSEISARNIIKILKYMEDVHHKDSSYKNLTRKAQVIPTIMGLLKNDSTDVRCRALEVLCTYAEDEKNKEEVAFEDNMRTIVKFLYQDSLTERERATELLYELSKSDPLSEKIGEVNGAILILLATASSSTENSLTGQNAVKILENLENCESNVLQMAKTGSLEPLLRLFLEGESGTQISLASFLGDLVLDEEMKVLVARTVGKTLVDLMTSESMLEKEMALKALNAISSYMSSAELLIEVGILPPLVGDLFATGNKQPPTRLKVLSATILSNLVASGAKFDSIEIDADSRTLVSEDVIFNLLHLISNTSPAIGCKILHVLVGFTESSATIKNVVNAIKKHGAIKSLIQLLEAAKMEIRLEAIKILHNITPLLGGEVATELCNSSGLGILIQIVSEDCEVSEEQAIAISLLAELPNEDPQLVECFLENASFAVLTEKLLKIHEKRIPGGRLSIRYFEGLVHITSKLTYVLDFPPAVKFVIDNKLSKVFADLVQINGLDNVQVASAKALGNLSQHTRCLSHVPKPPKNSFLGMLLPRCMNDPETIVLCKVHNGVCSLTETFCLCDGGVVNKLVHCLDRDNEKVVDAAFSALCTLLEDGLNIEKGATVLENAQAVMPITQILVSKKSEPLHGKAIWAIERLLRTESIVLEVIVNSNVRPILIEAYKKGDAQTRRIAENALKQMEILPDFSRIY